MSRLKILHVIPSISPCYGGPSQVVMDLCSNLIKLGYNAEIATTSAGGRFSKKYKFGHRGIIKGVPVYYFPQQFIERPTVSLPLIGWLKKNVRHYDLLHIHGLFSIPASIACYYARHYHIPYVIRPCGTLNTRTKNRRRLLKDVHLVLTGFKNLNHAAAIQVTSRSEESELLEYKLLSPIVLIQLAVTLPFSSSHIEDIFSREFIQYQNKKRILFLSRIDPIKGFDILIPAIAKLHKMRNDFVLVIAGTGPQKSVNSLKAMIKKYEIQGCTAILGFVDGQKKESLLRDVDILVLPSYHENFGMAVVEAMSRKKPVIITDQVQIHQEITTNCAGIVTECNAAALTAALDTLLSNSDLARDMGVRGFNLVTQKYTWDVVLPLIVQLYNSVVTNNS